jgi:hypothetical protein
MKKLYTLFFFWVLSLSFTKAQTNLVPNGGFEIHDTCPNTAGQINYAVNWNVLYESPDYFNVCAPNSSTPISVPVNLLGYQFPASGSAYAGFTTYISGETPPYREIMGTKLISPLVIGQKYYVSFKLNLSQGYNTNAGANKTGLRFTNLQHSLSNPPLINNLADVYTSSVIMDTTNWTTVFKSFIADSAYSFIELGNFFDDSNTTVLPFKFQNTNWSYYYVDDVCISTDSLYSLSWADTNTGINNFNYEKEITIYPNPSSGKIFIDIKNTQEQIEIIVYDIYGSEVKNIKIGANKNSIDFEDNGIYFISVTNGLYKSVKKIIISNQ